MEFYTSLCYNGKEKEAVQMERQSCCGQHAPLAGIQTAGLVCCSNGLPASAAAELERLQRVLADCGIETVCSPYLYAKDGVRSSSAVQRAERLMAFYNDPEIDAIFDVSGGDIANEILPYLDFAAIAKAKNRRGEPKQLWGYSDQTVLLNAVYAETGNPGVLYQMRYFTPERADTLFSFRYSFVQGNEMSGIVAGGNIRCLLKLAGTKFFPDLRGKLLLLEARSGLQPQMIAFLSQMQQMGIFEQISGILLGTFTQLEREGQRIEPLVQQFAGQLPIAKTEDIGHAADASAIVIGTYMHLSD